jgi:uncharacterized repeat protein (TIGR01451 family)
MCIETNDPIIMKYAKATTLTLAVASLGLFAACDDEPDMEVRETSYEVDRAEPVGDRVALDNRFAETEIEEIDRDRSRETTRLGDGSGQHLEIVREGLSSVRVGEETSYQLVVSNISDLSLYNIELRETISQAAGEGDDSDSNVETWTMDRLLPGESKTLDVARSFAAEGTAQSCLVVDYQTGMCTEIQVVAPDLVFEREIVDADGRPVEEALICDDVYAIYTVRNEGSGRSDAFVIEENFANGIRIAGNTNYSYEADGLAAGEELVERVALDLSNSAEYMGTAVLRVGERTIRSSEASFAAANPTVELMVDGPGEQYINRTVAYDVTVRNTSNVVAPDVRVGMMIPDIAQRVSYATQRLERDGDTFLVGALEPGESRTLRVDFDSPTPGDFEFAAMVEGYCIDDAQDRVATAILGVSAIRLEVVDLTDPVPVGDTTTYLVQVKNQGSAEELNINISAALPGSLQFVDAEGASEVMGEGNRLTFGQIDRLDPGDVIEWEVRTRASAEGKVRFEIELTSDANPQAVLDIEPTTLIPSREG